MFILFLFFGCNKKGNINKKQKLSDFLSDPKIDLNKSIVNKVYNQIKESEGFIILNEKNNNYYIDFYNDLKGSVVLRDRGNLLINLIKNEDKFLLFNLTLIKKNKLDSILNNKFNYFLNDSINKSKLANIVKNIRGKYFEFSLPTNFSKLEIYKILTLIKRINLLINKFRNDYSIKYFGSEFKVLPEKKATKVENIYPKVFYIYVDIPDSVP